MNIAIAHAEAEAGAGAQKGLEELEAQRIPASEGPIDLPEQLLIMIVSRVRDVRPATAATDARSDARSLCADMLHGIGSVSKLWRRLAKGVLMGDELAWLRVPGAAAAAECMSSFPRALSLSIVGNARPGDIGAVLGSRSVKQLRIDTADMRTIGRLGTLTGLRALCLPNCHTLRDLSPLSGLVSLHKLVLANCRRLSEIGQSVSALVGLQTLDLSGFPLHFNPDVPQEKNRLLIDVGPLSSLVGLHAVTLSGFNRLRDLGSLSALVGLHSLSVDGCRALTDLRPLSALMGLQSLDLWNCDQLTDVSPLSALVGLHSLSFNGCEQLTDLWPLSALVGLQSLDLSACQQLTDLRPLSALVRLQSLDLGRCFQLSDVSPLSALVSLESLNLRCCDALTDIRPLSALVGLNQLVHWNGITSQFAQIYTVDWSYS